MDEPSIVLAPGLPRVASLGARGFEDFFVPLGEGLLARASLLAARAGFELLRYPLPGTPVDGGRPDGAPRGAGTGWVRLARWTAAPRLAARLAARLTAPRSTSLAEREWNLLCRARAHGVSTPEPLAVGRAGAPFFAARSFLVVRELEGLRPLADLAREGLDPRAARRVARALGLALGRLCDAGIAPAHIDPASVEVGEARAEPAGAACVARTIDALRAAARGEAPPPGLRYGELPEIAFTDLAGARLAARVGAAERAQALARLAERLPPLAPPLRARALAACLRGLPRAERARLRARR